MKNAVQGRFIIKKVILNLIQDLQRILLTITSHPRKLLSGIPTSFTTQSGGDSQLRPLGMTPLFSNCAFTLIELLVVVLIIGILAAVALPQYQKVVAKSRAAEAVMAMSVLTKAADLYVMEKGYPTTHERIEEDLSIEIPVSNQYNYSVFCDNSICGVQISVVGEEEEYKTYYLLGNRSADETDWWKGCFYYTDTALAVCNSLIPNGYEVQPGKKK